MCSSIRAASNCGIVLISAADGVPLEPERVSVAGCCEQPQTTKRRSETDNRAIIRTPKTLYRQGSVLVYGDNERLGVECSYRRSRRSRDISLRDLRNLCGLRAVRSLSERQV